MQTFKNVGRHVEDLFDGRIVGVGEYVKLTDDQLSESHNQRLVSEGILILVEDTPKSRLRVAETPKDAGGDD